MSDFDFDEGSNDEVSADQVAASIINREREEEEAERRENEEAQSQRKRQRVENMRATRDAGPNSQPQDGFGTKNRQYNAAINDDMEDGCDYPESGRQTRDYAQPSLVARHSEQPQQIQEESKSHGQTNPGATGGPAWVFKRPSERFRFGSSKNSLFARNETGPVSFRIDTTEHMNEAGK